MQSLIELNIVPPFDTRPALLPMFLDKIQIGPGECWPWQACLTGGQSIHPQWSVREKKTGKTLHFYAHRLMYEMFVGPIPTGLDLDHLCKNPPCVNFTHVEPVTRGVNVLRGEGPSAINATKTHCKRGHALAGDNLLVYRNVSGMHRGCKACRAAYRVGTL